MNPKDASLPKSSIKKSAAYLEGDIAHAANIIPSGLSGVIEDGTISDFNVLVDKVPTGTQLKKEEYIGAINSTKGAVVSFDHLYLVEVDLGKCQQRSSHIIQESKLLY